MTSYKRKMNKKLLLVETQKLTKIIFVNAGKITILLNKESNMQHASSFIFCGSNIWQPEHALPVDCRHE